MKRGIVFFILFGFLMNHSVIISGQEGVEKIHNIKLTFLGLSYAFEKPVSVRSVINFEVGFASSFEYNIISDYLEFSPYLNIEPRFYYNYLYRPDRGKKVTNNSANFLALSFRYHHGISTESEIGNLFGFRPKGGLRRPLGNHFVFEFAVGMGIYYATGEGSIKPSPGIDLKFCFVP